MINPDENRPGTSTANRDAKVREKRKDSIQENKATPKRQQGQITEDRLPQVSVIKLHADRLGITKETTEDSIREKIESEFEARYSLFKPIPLGPFHILFFEYRSKPSKNWFLIPLKNISKTNNQVKNEEVKTSGTLIVWFRKLTDKAPEIFCVYKGAVYQKLVHLADCSFRTTIAKCCLDQNYLTKMNYVTVSGLDITVSRMTRTAGMFDYSLDVFERVYTDLEGQVIQDCELHKIIFKDPNQRKNINIAIGQYKVRILFYLNYYELSEILSHFSDLCRTDIAQTDNFSTLDMVRKVDDKEKIKKLDQELLTKFSDSIKKDDDNSGGLSLSHNYIEDWVLSSEIILYRYGKGIARWYSTPSLPEVKQKLKPFFVDAKTLCQELEEKTIKIIFQKKDEKYECKPLQSFLHGTCTLEGHDENYYKIVGKWFQFTAKYSEKINEKFSNLVKKLLAENQKVSSLLLPWSHKPKITLENLAKCFDLPKEKAERLMKLFEDLISLQKEKKLGFVKEIMSQITCLIQKQSPDADFWTVFNPNVPTEVLGRIKQEIEIEEISADRLTLFFRSFSILTENEYNCNYFMHHNRELTTIYGDEVLVKNVELFDVLIHDPTNKTTYLLHVKKDLEQTTSDACSQIRISSQLIWSSAFNHKSPNSYINLFWKTVMDYKGDDDRRHVLKEKLEKIGKDKFLGFFDTDLQIVFVLAFMDKKKDKLSSEIKSTIAKMEILNLNNHFKNYVSDGGYSFQLQVCQIPSEFKKNVPFASSV